MKLIWVLFLFNFFSNAYGKTVSCNGYVKSDFPVDLLKIQVKLFTVKGNLKYETECNPTDGFYTIPVYNKGKYLIKVIAPEGWVFEQDSKPIEIDGENINSCEADINFLLKAFIISGTVRSGNAPGPKNFRLALYNRKDKKIVSSTVTSEGGMYEFQAKPGNYEISTEDGSAQCIDRGKVHVEFGSAPVKVNPDIHISGYNMKIIVHDESDAPISDALVVLISSSNDQLKFDNIPVNGQRPKTSTRNGKWEYLLKSDKKGVVYFLCLPPGLYSINTEWSKDNAKINFGAEKQIRIDFKAVELIVKAESFNLGGLVTHKSNPIADVTILLNGEKKAVSNAEGKFVLINLTKKIYKISATKKNYKFSEIEKMLTVYSAVPQINVKRLAVCGNIEFDADKLGAKSDFRLLAHSVNSKKQVEFIEIDEKTNHFCKFLAPDTYIIEPSKSPVYSFSPKSVRVDVKSEPVLNLQFTQFKASIKGIVSCFENCKTVVIQLLRGNEIVAEQSIKNTFKFVNIIPALYSVRIRDDYNFWWDSPKQPVEVIDKDITGIIFRQTGYKVQIQSSHSSVFKYLLASDNSKQLSVDLIEGLNSVFFPQSGKYSFVIDSCHKFSLFLDHSTIPSSSDSLVVPSVGLVLLKATMSQASVSIVTSKPSGDVKFRLLIRAVDQSSEFTIDETANKQGNNHLFKFHIDHASIGKKFIITPQSKDYIFLPLTSSFTFDDKCRTNIAVFKSEIGKKISGEINPPVVGVLVKATLRQKNKDETPVVLEAETDATGSYKIGPVWNLDEWQISLIKKGYEFTRLDNSYNYVSIKLSHLKILFVDMKTTKPLADVLVSISGPNNYRFNDVTGDEGVLTIIGLATGEYFVRPILQEYKFNATSYGFKIKEGETKEITLYTKKFAYSAFGHVTTINKQPVHNLIRIEAVSKQCSNHQEEDTTDETTPEFRIRGLFPECLYRISLKSEDGQRTSSYPPFIDVLTNNEDKYEINFIVTPTETRMTLFGKIDFVQQQTGSYRINLYKNYNLVQEITVKSPATVFMFNNLTIDKETYIVGFDQSEARKREIEPVTVQFKADAPFKYVKLVLRNEKRITDVEVCKANIFGLFLIVFVAFWFLNQAKAKEIGKWFAETLPALIINRIKSDSSFNDGDYRKRKPKKQ